MPRCSLGGPLHGICTERMASMGVFELYSKRRKRELGEAPDIVSYDHFPLEFRTQVCYLLDDALGDYDRYRRVDLSEKSYEAVVRILRREYGVFHLAKERADGHTDLHHFVRRTPNIDQVLDVIELAFIACQTIHYKYEDPDGHAEGIANELNIRFREHGLGYQYEDGKVFRTDSTLLHEEAVRPALTVLRDPAFTGAEEEFLEAFAHHRRGREKDAMIWALKALESTLKVICKARGWSDAGQAKDLLNTVFTHGLIEPIWQSEFSALRSVLESGVSTGRNKRAGHGQGADSIVVPPYLAAFVLHQAAAAVLFLVEAYKAEL